MSYLVQFFLQPQLHSAEIVVLLHFSLCRSALHTRPPLITQRFQMLLLDIEDMAAGLKLFKLLFTF